MPRCAADAGDLKQGGQDGIPVLVAERNVRAEVEEGGLPVRPFRDFEFIQ